MSRLDGARSPSRHGAAGQRSAFEDQRAPLLDEDATARTKPAATDIADLCLVRPVSAIGEGDAAVASAKSPDAEVT
ncbi:hypothetical protein, partial [Bradyrhizobium cajani]|uniref:hypothetical protein n=1 Tax=Bradyrhizobium cajani TaxID=1928661 RepID=UPI00197ABCC5